MSGDLRYSYTLLGPQPALELGGVRGLLSRSQYQKFELATQLFHNGDRSDAVPILETLYPEALAKDGPLACVPGMGID